MDKFNKKHMLNAFTKPDEKLLFSKALDQVFVCTRDHKNKFTQFLNVAKCETFAEIIKSNFDINISLFGGIQGCERLKIGFSPTYYNIDNLEFPIVSIEIAYTKFSKNISHRDILGAIVGLGIDRDKIGDILLFETRAIAFVDEDIASFVCSNLSAVGSNKVDATIKDVEDLYMPLANYKDINISVSSIRLCSVISATFNMSRSQSAELIKGKKVFINWEKVVTSSETLKEQDTITVRGYGRIYVNEIIKKTSKDKFLINVHKYG